MGNCVNQTESNKDRDRKIKQDEAEARERELKKKEQQQKMELYDYQFIEIIGKGAFGFVWKVKKKCEATFFSIKKMNKTKILDKKCVESVMGEKIIMSRLKNPFFVNLIETYQDETFLYLVMELMTGGDLRFHLAKRSFTELQAKFIVACIVFALQCLRENKVIHRDLKPENLLFDHEGFVKLADFGCAQYYQEKNSMHTSGTPQYMSPEILYEQNHSYETDYYSLGLIAFELMHGQLPYSGKKDEIKEFLKKQQVIIKKQNIPPGWSLESADFINKLIQRRINNRLGYKGIDEIKNHVWLKDTDWDKIGKRKMIPPFIPNMLEQNYKSNQEKDQSVGKMIQLLKRDSVQKLFKGYDQGRHYREEVISDNDCFQKFKKEDHYDYDKFLIPKK